MTKTLLLVAPRESWNKLCKGAQGACGRGGLQEGGAGRGHMGGGRGGGRIGEAHGGEGMRVGRHEGEGRQQSVGENREMQGLCRLAHQEACLHCFEHGLLHIHTNNSLVDVSQPIAHRQGLSQPVAPSHGILLQGLKAAVVHWHNPMELRLQPPTLTPLGGSRSRGYEAESSS